MQVIYIAFAVLAAWRITELFTMDRVTEKLRTKIPLYLWTCPRCMSVWAGIAAAAIYHFYPLANLPFAMSYLYLQQANITGMLFKALNADRQVTLTVDPNWNISMQSKFTQPEVLAILQRTQAAILQQTKPDGKAAN